ncbi:cytochrome c [Archangium gephyra]|uniref:Cytochrome c n=1 Tax=Archangium gephyra TaxID=48 RepID=A0AAC8TCR9_9BACT|nr:cytochrome c [Archangium gephyra]AKJ01170.1 Putative diheme cytochrome c-553 [Archangium gephyra]REG24513.1 cytochrome c [Archangium gephyra]
MLKKILMGAGALVGLLVIAVVGLAVRGNSVLNSPVEVPMPAVTAATEPHAVERGRRLFMDVCASCHMQDGSGRVAGGRMPDMPEFLGTVYTANLTLHPTAGIGSLKDGELARMVRYGVRRDGRRALGMPLLSMSDEDLSAVIGFMRSGHPIFTPDERVQPPSELSTVGKLLISFLLPPLPNHPGSGVRAPPKGPTPEYGRYLAFSVYGCGDCHTPGLSPDKVDGLEAFSGGFEFPMPSGVVSVSTNLTFHENGLGKWTLEQFIRAMREGVNAEGYVVREPMLRVRGLEDVELEALYRFLQTLPKHPGKPVPTSATPRVKASSQASPEQLFNQLGCVGCHAEGARYRAVLKRSLEKPTAEVARWIRNPEASAPGTQMPTYAQLLDESQAMSLAAWVQQLAATIR